METASAEREIRPLVCPTANVRWTEGSKSSGQRNPSMLMRIRRKVCGIQYTRGSPSASLCR